MLLDRLDPQTIDSLAATTNSEAGNWFADKAAAIQTNVLGVLDPWLPRMGDDLTWMQIVGGLMIFPLLVGFRGSTKFLGAYCLQHR